MRVYRICHEKWAQRLSASGMPARWNSEGVSVIYTAASRALACLESLVHRSGEGDDRLYRVLSIHIPDTVKVEVVDIKKLPASWDEAGRCPLCRELGDRWVREARTCVLQVPSAIISGEFNYLINPAHKDFKKIRIERSDEFRFDRRLV
jgi:RES domain-containing protein